MSKRIFVGLSGGVDSAVSAFLLKKAGFEVTGVFMKNWSGESYGVDDFCPWRQDLDDSKSICNKLGIEHKIYNFEREYRELVINNFFSEYNIGRTPNPDVLCNKYIKFDLFMKKALSDGADMIATGHYSKTVDGRLFKARDTNKDQTYFLYQLTRDQLLKSVFPVGDITKPEVRRIAAEAQLPVADKKDSQGICFVGKVDVENFLRNELGEKQGVFVDADTNKEVGVHKGYWFYTIGQRKGIRIGGLSSPYFVFKKDPLRNIVYLVKGKDNPALWSSHAEIPDFHFIDPSRTDDYTRKQNYTAMVRYRGVCAPVSVKFQIQSNKTVKGDLSFKSPMWAIASGQSIVVFDGQECIGGGIC